MSSTTMQHIFRPFTYSRLIVICLLSTPYPSISNQTYSHQLQVKIACLIVSCCWQKQHIVDLHLFFSSSSSPFTATSLTSILHKKFVILGEQLLLQIRFHTLLDVVFDVEVVEPGSWSCFCFIQAYFVLTDNLSFWWLL